MIDIVPVLWRGEVMEVRRILLTDRDTVHRKRLREAFNSGRVVVEARLKDAHRIAYEGEATGADSIGSSSV